MTKACPFYINSATSKMLSPQLLALVHHTVPFTKMIDCCAWLWAPLQTLIGHYPGKSFYMGRTIKYRCCRTTLDFFFLTPFCRDKVSRSCYTGHAGLKPWSVTCVEAVWKFASYCNFASERWTRKILEWNIKNYHGNEEDLLTLGRQRCKDIPSGKAVAIRLWRLLHMIIGCGRYRILCFSRCTLVDRVKS